MKKARALHIALWVIALLHTPVSAQDRDGRYVVFFHDKLSKETPYTIREPSAFLSPRSLRRRTRQGITVKEEDLPVNPHHVEALASLQVIVYYTLRWVNAALIEAKSDQLEAIKKRPSVARIEYVAPPISSPPFDPNIALQTPPTNTNQQLLNATQLNMLGLQDMHADGIQGEGINIAVLDAGFLSVNKLSAFAALFQQERLTDKYDFVGHDTNVFRYGDHGTLVLSVMAADLPGVFRGGAPKANYQLYITEQMRGEYRIEEYNWMAAAERADSAGADIIQSSLGYNVFDDPSMNYTLSQLNGKTTVVSRAASKALSKGILVVTAAGNIRSSDWKSIVAPADGIGVLAVGGVTKNKVRSEFSSVGPTADGRIKPDVTALASGVLSIDLQGRLVSINGTSFASPSVTCLSAGLLQRAPNTTPAMLYHQIIYSGTQSTSPDNMVGYGTPNYNEIIRAMDSSTVRKPRQLPTLRSNPVSTPYLEIQLNSFAITSPPSYIGLSIYTLQGQQITEKEQVIKQPSSLIKYNISGLLPGVYLVQLRNQQKKTIFRFIKQ